MDQINYSLSFDPSALIAKAALEVKSNNTYH